MHTELERAHKEGGKEKETEGDVLHYSIYGNQTFTQYTEKHHHHRLYKETHI